MATLSSTKVCCPSLLDVFDARVACVRYSMRHVSYFKHLMEVSELQYCIMYKKHIYLPCSSRFHLFVAVQAELKSRDVDLAFTAKLLTAVQTEMQVRAHRFVLHPCSRVSK